MTLLEAVGRMARWRGAVPALFALALVLRLWAGWNVYGFLAVDDYDHYFLSGYRWHRTGSYEPFPAYRNPFGAWFVRVAFDAAAALGIRGKLAGLRTVSVWWAVVSMAGVLGIWLYARNRVREGPERFFVLFLAAAYFPFPFLSALKLSETLSMPLLALGVGLWSFGRRNRALFFAGVVLTGLAALVRFQNGLVALTLGVLALLDRERRDDFVWYIPAALVVVACQALTDVFLQKYPVFGTVRLYLEANRNTGAEYGVMPATVFFFMTLGLVLFPFCLAAGRRFWAAVKEHRELAWVFLVFGTAHSLVPHKEERFLIPVLPFLMVLVGSTLGKIVEERDGRAWRWYGLPFLAVNLGLLLVLSTYNPQRTVLLGMHAVCVPEPADLLVTNLTVSPYDRYFADRSLAWRITRWEDPAAEAEALAAWRGRRVVVLHLRNHEAPGGPPKEGPGYALRFVRRFRAHAVDRLVYALNPRFNPRRVDADLYEVVWR